VSCGLLLGRFMGFIREASIASTFGTSSKSDVAILALAIPDVIINIIVAGGISAALIPEFKSLGSKLSGLLFAQVTILSAVIFSGLALIFCLNPDWIVSAFAPGLPADSFASATGVMSKVVWLIPLTGLSGVTAAFLQSKESFLVPALGTFIFNSVIVLGFLFVIRDTKELSDLTMFILLGGVFRLFSQYSSSIKHLSLKGLFGGLLISKPLLRRYCVSIVSFGVLSLFPVLARAVASFGAEGDISKLNFSWRLAELPLGLIVAAVVVSSFPRLSAAASSDDQTRFRQILGNGFFLSTLFAFSVASVVFANADFLVRLAYGWGEGMGESDLLEISKLLQIGILGLPFQAAIAMSSAGLNAQKCPGLISRAVVPGFALLCGLSWAGYAGFGLVFSLVAALVLKTVKGKYAVGYGYGLFPPMIFLGVSVVLLSSLMKAMSLDGWLCISLSILFSAGFIVAILKKRSIDRRGAND
jgi:putative peptidoglycan lipid II flippase